MSRASALTTFVIGTWCRPMEACFRHEKKKNLKDSSDFYIVIIAKGKKSELQNISIFKNQNCEIFCHSDFFPLPIWLYNTIAKKLVVETSFHSRCLYTDKENIIYYLLVYDRKLKCDHVNQLYIYEVKLCKLFLEIKLKLLFDYNIVSHL